MSDHGPYSDSVYEIRIRVLGSIILGSIIPGSIFAAG